MNRSRSPVLELALRRFVPAICVAGLLGPLVGPVAAQIDLRGAAKAVKKQARAAESTARQAEREATALTGEVAEEARGAAAEAERLATEAREAAARAGEEALELARSLAREAEVQACTAAVVVLREKAKATAAVQREAAERLAELREDREFVDRMAATVEEFQRRYAETIEAMEARVPTLDLAALDDLDAAMSVEGICSGRAGEAFPAVARLGGELAQLAAAGGDSGDRPEPDRLATLGFQGAKAKFLGGEAGAGLAWALPADPAPDGFYSFFGPQLGSFGGASQVVQFGLWPMDFCGLAGPYLALGFVPVSYGTAARSVGLSIDIVLDVALIEEEGWRGGVGGILDDYFVGVVWNLGVSTSSSKVTSKLAAKTPSTGGAERGWQVPHFAVQGGSTGIVPFAGGCGVPPVFGSG